MRIHGVAVVAERPQLLRLGAVLCATIGRNTALVALATAATSRKGMQLAAAAVLQVAPSPGLQQRLRLKHLAVAAVQLFATTGSSAGLANLEILADSRTVTGDSAGGLACAPTPLRNSMSNAAQDQTSSFTGLYKRAFGSPSLPLLHRLRIGFTGAVVSAPAACPQWCMIGPAFHILHSHVPTPLAILGAATLETAITYGSQTRNAQMAYERASVLLL